MRRLFTLMVVVAWLLSSCAGMQTLLYDPEFSMADGFAREKRYSDAASAYAKIAKKTPGTSRGADALFAAACTRIYPDNTQKDYALALQEFDEFIKLYPDHRRISEAQQWRSLVKTIVELKKENERLTQNIEQLKKIDIRHEERRRK